MYLLYKRLGLGLPLNTIYNYIDQNLIGQPLP